MASGAVRTQAKQKSVRVPVQKHHKYSPTAKRAFSLLLNLITGTIYKPIMLNNSISVSGLSFISGFHTLSCSPLPDWHWTDEMEWGLSLCLKVIPSGKIALPRAAGLCAARTALGPPPVPCPGEHGTNSCSVQTAASSENTSTNIDTPKKALFSLF